jgi:hypothetical protein
VFLFYGLPIPAQEMVLYSTTFEPAQGYEAQYELAGQAGWLKFPPTSGGNGLITNFLGTQAAYVGLFPLIPKTNYISVWHPVDYSPPAGSNVVVEFSTRMLIADSTTNQWDNFYWTVYNRSGEALFSLDFDVYEFAVYYLLDGTNEFQPTGALFTNDVPYTFKLTMDLGRNLWSALLGQAVLATNLPITTAGAALTIGDIDAAWVIYDDGAPGDNFMLFDDYKVSVRPAEQPPLAPAAHMTLLARTPTGQSLLRVTGQNGTRQAVEASSDLSVWVALKTNTISDGEFDYIDNSGPVPFRFYRARFVP